MSLLKWKIQCKNKNKFKKRWNRKKCTFLRLFVLRSNQPLSVVSLYDWFFYINSYLQVSLIHTPNLKKKNYSASIIFNKLATGEYFIKNNTSLISSGNMHAQIVHYDVYILVIQKFLQPCKLFEFLAVMIGWYY